MDNMFLLFILAIINGMLVDNVILSRFYGICPFLGVSRKTQNAFGMGIAVLVVILLATLICWPIYYYLLIPANIAFMDTIVYILVIASLVQVLGLVIKKYSPVLYKALGIYLPLITTNCAVLGVVQSNSDMQLSFINSLANAIGTGLGFLIIIILFSYIRVRLDSSNVPKALKGIPVALFAASLMAMAFLGLVGVIKI